MEEKLGLKSNIWIKEKAEQDMVEPFVDYKVLGGIIFKGLSFYVYDTHIVDVL